MNERISRNEILVDPYNYYHSVRAEGSAYWSDLWGGWLLTRYADVVAALHDPRLSANRLGLILNQMPAAVRQDLGQLETYMTLMIGFSDPPYHTRIRAIARRSLSPAVFERLRPKIQGIVDELLVAMAAHRRVDIIAELALPLPEIVICEMLGVQIEDRALIKEWSDRFVGLLGTGRAEPGAAERTQQSMMQLIGYFRDIVAHHPRAANGSLLDTFIAAEESGELLSEDELLANCVALLIGGHETTTNLIGNGLLALLRNPDQLERLRSDPALIATAVEEMLRFDSPLQRAIRVALEDLEIGGQQIRKGDLVLAMLGSANRDPERFLKPDNFDVGRSDNAHMAFGHGTRFCLGAPLARIEAQIAISELVRRFPDLQLASDEVERVDNLAFRGLKSLSVII